MAELAEICLLVPVPVIPVLARDESDNDARRFTKSENLPNFESRSKAGLFCLCDFLLVTGTDSASSFVI